MRPFVTGDGVGREAIVAMETGGRLRLATCYARDAGNLLVCFDVAGAAGAVHGWLLAEACLQRAPDADAERCLEEEEREAALIATEAGAKATARDGAALRFNNPHPQVPGLIVAGPALHEALLERLSPE